MKPHIKKVNGLWWCGLSRQPHLIKTACGWSPKTAFNAFQFEMAGRKIQSGMFNERVLREGVTWKA